uniref:Elongator complex protein 4 n=1 Tax=Xiphophorus couchianus TaxID=32473 RepID=A0A3B5LXG0_9TELE
MAAPVNSVCKTSADRLQVNCTSFQKKTRSKLISIPGTRPSVQNGQLLVSTGVTSLDYLLGGGLAVGTVLLIEEDRFDSYSRMILKYFLAEGVVCRHELFVATAQDNPDEILQVGDETLSSSNVIKNYNSYPCALQSALASSSRFGHYYDVSKTMEVEIRQAAKCHRFYLPDHITPSSAAHRVESYSALLKSLQEVIHREGFDLSKSRNILRVGLHSLGSALWGDDLCCHDKPRHSHALTTFLYGLRALLRSSLSVAVVTLPSHLIQDRALMGNITRLCDNAIALESFKGSERETNPLYKDYHGLLYVRQVPHLNCLARQLPDHKDLAFKLKRKQFTIERLHLPPDLSETVSRVSRGEPVGVASACGSSASGTKNLDF